MRRKMMLSAFALLLVLGPVPAAFSQGTEAPAVSQTGAEKENAFVSGLRRAGGAVRDGASAVVRAPGKAWQKIRGKKDADEPVYIKIHQDIFEEYREFFSRDLKFRQIEWPSKDDPDFEFSGLPKDVEKGRSVLLRASDDERGEDTIFIITGSKRWKNAPAELHEYTVTAEEFWRLIRELSGGRANSTAAEV